MDEPELGIAPRQCTSSLDAPCTQLSGEKRKDRCTQPPYSPYLAPVDFFLFPKLKSTLKGRHFDTFDEIQKNLTK